MDSLSDARPLREHGEGQMTELPDDFKKKVLGTFGDSGRDWIHRFPEILEQCRERWRLTLGMKDLPVPEPAKHNLPTFAQWTERAFRRTREACGHEGGPLPVELLDQAEQVFRSIQDSRQKEVLLHGDLHHENILYDEERGWTAIDPKGVIGDPCLEVGRYLHNQLPEDMSLREKERRIAERTEILSSELGESEERIKSCAFVDLVLSLCWSLEDTFADEGWQNGVAVARLLGRMVDA